MTGAQRMIQGMERLQKYLAGAGVASRRRCEELIAAGRVVVNGVVVQELGACVQPGRDDVRLDGRLVAPPRGHVYLALHKPRGVLTAAADARGRRVVTDLVPHSGRVYPVGRLDADSEGLVLLTDDGDLANRVAHPRYGVEKEYAVTILGTLAREEQARLRQGVEDEGERLAALRLLPRGGDERRSEWAVVLRQGRKREVRRLFAAVGHPVLRLVRTRMGPVELGSLPAGAWRPLTEREVEGLRGGQVGERTSGRSAGVPGGQGGSPRRDAHRRGASAANEGRSSGEMPRWARAGETPAPPVAAARVRHPGHRGGR